MDIGYWILSGIGMFSFVWFLALSKVQYIERWGQRTLIWRSGWLRTNNCIISESNNHYTSIVSVDLPVVLTNFHFQFFVRGNRHVRHVRGNRAFEMRWRWGPWWNCWYCRVCQNPVIWWSSKYLPRSWIHRLAIRISSLCSIWLCDLLKFVGCYTAPKIFYGHQPQMYTVPPLWNECCIRFRPTPRWVKVRENRRDRIKHPQLIQQGILIILNYY